MAPEIVVIGTSLGGLNALGVLLADLPAEFALPLAVVQHRDIQSKTLMREMRRVTPLCFREPSDKEAIEPGCLYMAPADYHLLVEPGVFHLSTEGPVNYARPSIDVLFESAADAYGPRTLGVILTGASKDGAHGCAEIKRVGGTVLVQDPKEAECPVMPAAAMKASPVDGVLTLAEIRARLIAQDTARRTEAASRAEVKPWKPG